jgi:RecJ-like exonuclease
MTRHDVRLVRGNSTVNGDGAGSELERLREQVAELRAVSFSLSAEGEPERAATRQEIERMCLECDGTGEVPALCAECRAPMDAATDELCADCLVIAAAVAAEVDDEDARL